MEKAAASSSRYERKFAIEAMNAQQIKSWVKQHPALFREIFSPRRINNIYLDTPGLKAFFDNTSGISKRKKVRIRWYGDTFGEIQKPVLEYKRKSGMLGEKDSWKLAPFSLNQGLDRKILQDIVGRSELPEYVRNELISMAPKLLNSYVRTYYQSANKLFRITVDEELKYYQISMHNNFFLQKKQDMGQVILELKYAAATDEQADAITRLFPFRLTKSSKYVNGIDHNRPFMAT